MLQAKLLSVEVMQHRLKMLMNAGLPCCLMGRSAQVCWLCRKYNKNIASLWEEAIYNVTHVGNTAKSYSTSPYLLSKLGQPVPLDEATVAGSIANYAFGECVPMSGLQGSFMCIGPAHAAFAVSLFSLAE